MQIEFTEQIQKTSSVWTIFLVFVEDNHAENHSDCKSFNSPYVFRSGHIISQKQKISQHKCRMIIHNHIVASQNHQKKDSCRIYNKCPDRIKACLANRGAIIRITKIPTILNSPCVVLIPKSACRSTSTASSTVTPTTLLPLPIRFVYNVTTATQNAITRYTLKL